MCKEGSLHLVLLMESNESKNGKWYQKPTVATGGSGREEIREEVIYSPEDSQILQEEINILQEWAKCWMMKFNPIKYECLRVSNQSSPSTTHVQYFIKNVKIKQLNTSVSILMKCFHGIITLTSYICNKADNARVFLQWNSRQFPSCVTFYSSNAGWELSRISLQKCSDIVCFITNIAS